MCRHCRMDDVWVGWETRLFRLETRAMGAGGVVSHEDALRQVRPPQPPPCACIIRSKVLCMMTACRASALLVLPDGIP